VLPASVDSPARRLPRSVTVPAGEPHKRWLRTDPTSPDYGPTDNHSSGDIAWVRIDIGDDSLDHLIKPEDRVNIAMAKQ
jgi:arylsulfatase